MFNMFTSHKRSSSGVNVTAAGLENSTCLLTMTDASCWRPSKDFDLFSSKWLKLTYLYLCRLSENFKNFPYLSSLNCLSVICLAWVCLHFQTSLEAICPLGLGGSWTNILSSQLKMTLKAYSSVSVLIKKGNSCPESLVRWSWNFADCICNRISVINPQADLENGSHWVTYDQELGTELNSIIISVNPLSVWKDLAFEATGRISTNFCLGF